MAKPNLGEVDEELDLALELSKKTFLEEEKKRNSAEIDLIMVEDPEERERNIKIEEIKRLYNVQSAQYPEGNCFNSSLSYDNNFMQTKQFSPIVSNAQGSQISNQPFYSTFFQPSQYQSTFINNNYSLSNVSGCAVQNQAVNNYYNPFIPSTSNNQLQNLNSSKNVRPVQLSPLKIPFCAPTYGDDLIDLQISPRPRSPRSINMTEFDPLYNRIIKDQQNSSLSTTVNKEDLALPVVETPSPNSNRITPTKILRPEKKAEKTGFEQGVLLTCDDFNILPELACDFYKEKELLIEESQRLALNESEKNNVFFLTPVVDYYTTSADTIKLVVYQDDTWPKDTPEEPRKLEFACDVRSTSEEILVCVLLRLLSQETIFNNGGQIPLEDYALKLYGSDEFLVSSVEIGKHPFVGRYLSLGKDVMLEVGKQTLSPTLKCTKKLNNSIRLSPFVNTELFQTFNVTLKSHVEKCLAEPHDRRLCQGVVQCLKMLSTFMNNVQPIDLVAAIDLFCAETELERSKHAIHSIVVAVRRLLRMYCRSVLTDFSVQADKTVENEKDLYDASLFNDKVLISVETLHNLPSQWQGKYKAYFIEAHLMYGPKSYGIASSNLCSITTKFHFSYVVFSFWAEFDALISSMPRESQICFIVRGIPIVSDNCETTNSASTNLAQEALTAHRIASASLPLYNYENILIQGPLLLPLSLMIEDVVHPWGPRPLIRSAEDPVLVVKCLEYEYKIRFPTNIPQCKAHWREFDTLPIEEQDNLLLIVDGGISSHMLSDDDKQLLWSNRNCLYRSPKALSLVLASSFSWGVYSLSNIYLLLQKWEKLSPASAIELLLPYFQDKIVRKKAVEYLRYGSSEFLFNLLTQFVEALRYETFENSVLAIFLLEQSTANRRFAFELYWQLQQRSLDTRNNAYSARCFLLQQLLLDLKIPGFQNAIAHQHLFLDGLDRVSREVKEASESNMNMVLQKALFRLTKECDMSSVRLPIAPGFQCCDILIEDCGYFNSLTKPIKIIIRGRKSNYGVIFKVGDDLRQDAIVLQLVGVMNDIWLNHQLDLRMVMFRCLPTGMKKGMIELVPDCSTLREIQTTPGATGVFKDDVLNTWLLRQNPSEFQYKAALENFRRSCAGWCVATYVLGIGDRHNDNILVTTTGHVFHIDFGKYMGDWQTAAGFKRDRVPFVLTADMAYVINGGSQNTTEYFQKFIDDCCKAFNLLRRNCQMLINIIRFMSCSDIPGMNMDSVSFVESNLMLGLENIQATAVFTRMIEESLRSKFPRLNFFAHTLAQLKSNPLLFSGRSQDMNRLSFISDMYSDKSDSKIDSVHVSSYEKWHTPEKVYMYKLLIKRVNENVSSEIYRSFAEFEELHWKLCFRFSSKAIPSLTLASTVIGRKNVRAIASKRQVDLENFLQNFFRLSEEVAHSDLVYTFFHTIYRDSEPDAARNQEVRGDLRNDHNITPPQIHLRFSYNESLAELRVFVGHAKQLPLIGCREQMPDSYVKTYLREPHTPQLKHWKRKTGIVRNAQNPTYNTELLYSLGHKQIEEFTEMILEISIWHAGCTVLKDNFQLCESLIPLNFFVSVSMNRRGIRSVDKWYSLKLCFT